jgi:hypothetical protein
MQTNKSINLKSDLGKAAKKLIKAAFDYWNIYQKEIGPSAVVWVEDDNGHFVLFTRSEHKESIMYNANRETRHQPVLFYPFTKK